MKKPLIKRAYSQLAERYFWHVSFPLRTGWERLTWQEMRAFRLAQSFADDLNRNEVKGN